MQLGGVQASRIVPTASTSSVLGDVSAYDFEQDVPRVAMPRPESCLVVRFGPSAQNGLDVHAFGAQLRARRKVIRGGQRSVTARLRLGAQDRVLGISGPALAGRVVALEDLWGAAATRRLIDRLAAARDTITAAAVLESAIAERLAVADQRHGRAALALEAADRLTSGHVNEVALELGVSERHLRRVFREMAGISPKQFARLTRFHRALDAANERASVSWARIAAAAGYYDQAHLIAEFRVIAGTTPQALLAELRPAGATVLSPRLSGRAMPPVRSVTAADAVPSGCP